MFSRAGPGRLRHDGCRRPARTARGGRRVVVPDIICADIIAYMVLPLDDERNTPQKDGSPRVPPPVRIFISSSIAPLIPSLMTNVAAVRCCGIDCVRDLHDMFPTRGQPRQ